MAALAKNPRPTFYNFLFVLRKTSIKTRIVHQYICNISARRQFTKKKPPELELELNNKKI